MSDWTACANPACPTHARTLPHVADTWPDGLCPCCRDREEQRQVLEMLCRDTARRQAEEERRAA